MPLYFAYGSNLSSARLRQPERAPGATVIGSAALGGHVLRFTKRGADESGKCTIFATGARSDGVWGVVWEVEPEDLARLDRVEGSGYERVQLQVTTANQRMDVVTYRARPDWIDPTLVPADWYLALVIGGAREHGLPASWIRALEAVATATPAADLP